MGSPATAETNIPSSLSTRNKHTHSQFLLNSIARKEHWCIQGNTVNEGFQPNDMRFGSGLKTSRKSISRKLGNATQHLIFKISPSQTLRQVYGEFVRRQVHQRQATIQHDRRSNHWLGQVPLTPGIISGKLSSRIAPMYFEPNDPCKKDSFWTTRMEAEFHAESRSFPER